jgi:hypothetical protein
LGKQDSIDHFFNVGARGEFTPLLNGEFNVGVTTRKLSGRARKAVLLVHVLSAAAWLGIDLALGICAVVALSTEDVNTAGVAIQAIDIFAIWPMFGASVVCMISGVVLGVVSKYGLVRYWWVAIKLLQAIVLNILVFVALLPGVSDLDVNDTTLTADWIRDAIGSAATDMLFPPIVSFLMLAIALILSVWKPVRKTPWSERRTGGDRRA